MNNFSKTNLKSSSKVYLVGAGPGDPELLTVKGKKVLEKADVVIYDYLASPGLLSLVPSEAEKIYVGKKAGYHLFKQEKINELIKEKASKGGIIVRLKGGDPFVFGRGGEECLTLAEAGYPFEVIPGISAGIAGPCYAGIPVTHRYIASSTALITGHESQEKSSSNIHWEHLAKGVDTLIFYMGMHNLNNIVTHLIKNGKPPETPAAVIRWATTSKQITVTGTLGTINDAVIRNSIKPPAIIIIGNVVSLRNNLAWFEKNILFGKRIINTRLRSQVSPLSEHLSILGADIIELPTIQIEALRQQNSCKELLRDIENFHWLIFTSPSSVNSFLSLFFNIRGDIRLLKNVKIACMGHATSNTLKSYYITPDIAANQATIERFLEVLKKLDISWNLQKVFIPIGKEDDERLSQSIEKWGAQIKSIITYISKKPENNVRDIIDLIVKKDYDLIIFSHSSAFQYFVSFFKKSQWEDLKSTLKAVSISPITTSTMQKYGVTPVIEADESSKNGIIRAIDDYYKN
jgi:uroporphyrinogen III methyltransferase/synthase